MMHRDDFSPDAPGELVTISRTTSPDNDSAEPVYAFVPHPLPPPFDYDDQLVTLIGEAMLALGRLDTVARDLPNPSVLVRPFLRREAVLSSRIEGTRAELHDVILFEEEGSRDAAVDPDVQETANYVSALEYALSQPVDRDLSLYLIRELHQLLFQGVPSVHVGAGQYRQTQIFIGAGHRIENAEFVPPPPEQVPVLLEDLERFMREPASTQSLVRIALIHYQFEAIHPFLDGNGRIGRILISLLLRHLGIMRHPFVDMSAYVYEHRDAYLQGLRQVSLRADWQGWFLFLIGALHHQAEDAYKRSLRLVDLRSRYLTLSLRPPSVSPSRWERFVDTLFSRPAITTKRAQDLLGVSFPTSQRTIMKLAEEGLLVEATGRRRDRIYQAPEILDILA